MKKIIKLGLVASISCLFVSNLTAGTISPVNFTKYPLPKAFTSQSRGGDLPDKVAATDGVGTLLLPSVTTNKNKINNSAYNKLLYQNEDKLTDKINLNNLLQSGQIKVSNKDLDKINTVMGKKLNIPNGTACDDGNPDTINDMYINNVCQGIANLNNIVQSQSAWGGGGFWYKKFNITVTLPQNVTISKMTGFAGSGLCTNSNGIVNKPAYIQYNLKKSFAFKHFYLQQTTQAMNYNYYYRSQIKKIKISCSNDNTNWQVIYTKDNMTKYTNFYININPNNISCSYWKIGIVDNYWKGNTSKGYCQFQGITGFY